MMRMRCDRNKNITFEINSWVVGGSIKKKNNKMIIAKNAMLKT